MPGLSDKAPALNAIPGASAAYAKTEVRQFIFHSPAEKKRYDLAASLFPSFCRDWQRKLHDREVDGFQNIDWKMREGYETATYTTYGSIESCETKESAEGVPIGRITYEESSFYLAGKTIEEAKRAEPKLVGRTHTLEIFSWDKDTWFY